MKQYYLYILTNKPRGVIYVGSTNNLYRRLEEHKLNTKSFAYKYKLTKLVYYEISNSYESVAYREKQIKNWRRNWKIDLVESNNPNWENILISS